MRVLIFGAAGMLGHKLIQRLGRDSEIAGTIRTREPTPELVRAISGAHLIPSVEAEDLSSVKRTLEVFKPDVVLNCIGIIKQLKAAKDPIPSIRMNSLFPHELARMTSDRGARLIHFSTDCVFSGAQGPYFEGDPADAQDLYGRSKFLGEVGGPGCLTIRSSIIGHELQGHVSLVDWFLAQKGAQAKGFANALYSGLTTLAMANLVARIVSDWPDLDGIWQVSSEPVNKFELLTLVNKIYELGVRLDRDETFHCDRRLDSNRFRQRTGWRPSSWEQMVRDMHSDWLAYQRAVVL